jgi:hypothetical protein
MAGPDDPRPQFRPVTRTLSLDRGFLEVEEQRGPLSAFIPTRQRVIYALTRWHDDEELRRRWLLGQKPGPPGTVEVEVTLDASDWDKIDELALTHGHDWTWVLRQALLFARGAP